MYILDCYIYIRLVFLTISKIVILLSDNTVLFCVSKCVYNYLGIIVDDGFLCSTIAL